MQITITCFKFSQNSPSPTFRILLVHTLSTIPSASPFSNCPSSIFQVFPSGLSFLSLPSKCRFLLVNGMNKMAEIGRSVLKKKTKEARISVCFDRKTPKTSVPDRREFQIFCERMKVELHDETLEFHTFHSNFPTFPVTKSSFYSEICRISSKNSRFLFFPIDNLFHLKFNQKSITAPFSFLQNLAKSP